MLGIDTCRVAFVTLQNQFLTEFLSFILYTMQEKECKGLVISKKYLEVHYEKQYARLQELFGADWYIYQYYTIYYLVVGECETSFISLKLDLNTLLDGIEFGILLNKVNN